MAATFFLAVLIIFTQGSSTELLKENCISPVSAGSSLSNHSANKVWSLSSLIWPTSGIYGTKSSVGEAAGAASQTGLPPGGPVPGNKQQINGSAGRAMSWLTHCRAVSHYPLNPDGDLPNLTDFLTYSRALSHVSLDDIVEVIRLVR